MQGKSLRVVFKFINNSNWSFCKNNFVFPFQKLTYDTSMGYQHCVSECMSKIPVNMVCIETCDQIFILQDL